MRLPLQMHRSGLSTSLNHASPHPNALKSPVGTSIQSLPLLPNSFLTSRMHSNLTSLSTFIPHQTRSPQQHPRNRSTLTVVASGPAGGMGSGGGGNGGRQVDSPAKAALVGIAVSYMALIVVLPFFNVFVQAFSNGPTPFIETLFDPDFQQAVKMTLLLAGVAVPINTVFGIAAAIFLSRNDFPGKVFAISVLDLPFSISPVVTGMMFVLLYGRKGLFAPLIAQYGFPIVFAFPGEYIVDRLFNIIYLIFKGFYICILFVFLYIFYRCTAIYAIYIILNCQNSIHT